MTDDYLPPHFSFSYNSALEAVKENYRLHAENKALKADILRRIHVEEALKACVESHEESIKTLKREIEYRSKEREASITMFVGGIDDVRYELYRLYRNRIDADKFEKVVKCCFGFLQNDCELDKNYLADSVRNWWETGGAECWDKEDEPAYAPKSDTE